MENAFVALRASERKFSDYRRAGWQQMQDWAAYDYYYYYYAMPIIPARRERDSVI